MTNEIIDKIADKLQVPVGMLWDCLLRQAPIYAISTILIVAMGFAIFAISLYIGIRYAENESDAAGLFGGISMIALILSIIASLCCINDVLSAIFNPQYWALSQILHAIK